MRSIGAAEVLATAAETPPIRKSTMHVASSMIPKSDSDGVLLTSELLWGLGLFSLRHF